MVTEFRKDAEPIAEEIINKIEKILRYKMQVWPKEDDLKDMKREIKSIIVQNMVKKENV